MDQCSGGRSREFAEERVRITSEAKERGPKQPRPHAATGAARKGEKKSVDKKAKRIQEGCRRTRAVRRSSEKVSR